MNSIDGEFTMTNAIPLSRTLARRLQQVSARSRRSPAVLARQAIAQRLDYLEGRLKAIDAGFADLESTRGATTTEVLAGLDRILGKHGHRAKKAA